MSKPSAKRSNYKRLKRKSKKPNTTPLEGTPWWTKLVGDKNAKV